MKTRITAPNSYMEYYENSDGHIVIQLGGMQVSRKTLGNLKSSLRLESDGDAINVLTQVAERGFRRFAERFEG